MWFSHKFSRTNSIRSRSRSIRVEDSQQITFSLKHIMPLQRAPNQEKKSVEVLPKNHNLDVRGTDNVENIVREALRYIATTKEHEENFLERKSHEFKILQVVQENIWYLYGRHVSSISKMCFNYYCISFRPHSCLLKNLE